MTEKNKKRRKLSKYKDCFCVHCYEELALSLGHRRGDDLIICPECDKEFSIDELEKFMKSLSNIIGGDCPNCEQSLSFNVSERVPNSKIECPMCKESFYIDETEKPSKDIDTRNISEITEVYCPNCSTDLLLDLEERLPKAKIKCSVCKNSFYLKDLSRVNENSGGQIKPYNSTAILAFILSLFLPIIPLFLGVSALNEIKRTKERGEGLATFAVVLGILQIFIYLALFGMGL